MHAGPNRPVSVRLRTAHGHLDASVAEPETLPQLRFEAGKQCENVLVARGAGYRGAVFSDQENHPVVDKVIGVAKVGPTDTQEVIVRGITAIAGDGHIGACRGSHSPVSDGVPPDRPLRKEAGRTVAILRAACGDADTHLEDLAKIFGFREQQPRVDDRVAPVGVVRITLAALVRDDEQGIELDLEASVERDEDREILEVLVVVGMADSVGVEPFKEPGTEEDAAEGVDPADTIGADTVRRRAQAPITQRRKHEGVVPSLAEEGTERQRSPWPSSLTFGRPNVAEDRLADHFQDREV